MRLLAWLLLAAAAPAARGRECEKMKVPFCQRMPYEDTRLPNLLGHTSQGEVNLALEPLSELQDSGCFGHYTFMLCSALAPPCLDGLAGPPAPCRHVCERARDRCYGLLLMYNVTEAWPDCDLMPREGDSSPCLTPTSLTPRDNCHCLKKHQPEKPTTKLMDNRDYDYSIKARMEGFAPSHFPSILSVTVLDIYREGIVELVRNNISFIRTNTSCKCPELESGKEYLIMGHEDFNRTELLLTKNSYVVPWSEPVESSYGQPARDAYRDESTRSYSRRYGDYVHHHGYHLGFHRPSFTQLMMLGGAYGLYRHYKNKQKLGKVYGYPGYGGYGSSFGALGGGGYGALGNPRGKFTNFNNFNNLGATPGFSNNYGYNSYNAYNGFGQRPASQVPSYPITHKPNYGTSKPEFKNRNLNPSYPVTQKPYRTSSGSRSSSTRKSGRRSSWGRSRSSGTRSRSWGRRYDTTRAPSWGTQTQRWATTQRPYRPATTQRPFYPATTRRPFYPATTRRPFYPATTRRPSYPASTRRPSYSATRRPRPSYPVTSRSRYSSSRSSRRSSSRSSGRSRSRFG